MWRKKTFETLIKSNKNVETYSYLITENILIEL